MKHRILLSACLFTVACAEVPDNGADIVFMNAAVYTLDADMPWAEAVAVKGNEIVYVGDNEGAAVLIGNTTRHFNLSGQMLLPGFIDAHMHPVAGGAYAKALSLTD